MIKLHRGTIYLRTWSGSYAPAAMWRRIVAGYLRLWAANLCGEDDENTEQRLLSVVQAAYMATLGIKVLSGESGMVQWRAAQRLMRECLQDNGLWL